jgi:muconolactone D-isomerase
VLFHVTMTVKLPHDMDAAATADLKAREKAVAAEHQTAGRWRHLWRVAGAYANVSIFDVRDNAELHDLLTGLPLFPFMEIAVTPLCRHPSSVRDGDL